MNWIIPDGVRRVGLKQNTIIESYGGLVYPTIINDRK